MRHEEQGTTYGSPVGLGSLAATKVAQGPGGISEHGKLAAVTEKSKERAEGTLGQDEITAAGTITGNVAQSPHGLLADIGFGTAQELDEDGNGTGLDNNLGLRSRARGNVGKSPGGLELDKSVGRAEELDEAAHNASLDDLFDWRVALLAEQFAELGGGLDLSVNLFREDASHHLREVLVELRTFSVSILSAARFAAECGPSRPSSNRNTQRGTSGVEMRG